MNASDQSTHRALTHRRAAKALTVVALLAAAVGTSALAVEQTGQLPAQVLQPLVQIFDRSAPLAGPVSPEKTFSWIGRDIDGDGAADIVNPTGHAPRDVDAYGSGAFGASRDGGVREHLGVDYIANAGQAILAPISGFISKIGFAYAGDDDLRFVEIENPALKLSARVFYIDPSVEVGDAVRLGTPIGKSHSLQVKYPDGMTDHVHLEMADAKGAKLDATSMIHQQAD